MRSTPLSLGIGLVLLATVASPFGCAEPPPPATPATQPKVAVAEPTPPAPAVDLSPVPEPTDILVSARWKSPNATLSGLSGCAGVPQTLVDSNVKKLVDNALAHAFHSGVDGQQIADALALDAPVDLVVALEPGKRGTPNAHLAFSVGLTSLERARGALEAAGPLVELQPGLWRVGTKENHDLSCVIGPAAGAAPARLICGQHDKDVIALGPYLARNLPVAPPPAQDIHLELRFTPIDARYGTDLRRVIGFLPNYARMQWAIGEPHYDHALEDAAGAIAHEGGALVSDLDQLTLDVNVDGNTCLSTKAALQFRGKSSWLAGTIAERAAQSAPPPAIFWRVPLDSDSASYGLGSDPARYDGIIHALRGLLEGKLAKEKIGSEADRKALAGLIALPLGKNTNVVVASGHGGAAPAVAAGAKPSEQVAGELVGNYLGWTLLGFDEGPAALSKLIKDAVGVYGRKGLVDPLRKALDHDADALPTVKLVPAPAQLGKGALDLELRFELPASDKVDLDAKKKKKGGSIPLHALLMGDGQTTWIAIGTNRDELVKRLVSVKSGAPEAGTLAARPGLEPLRNGKALSNGFMTLGMLTRTIASVLQSPLLPASASAPVAELTNTLNNLPHKGDTPIFVTSTATDAGPRSEFLLNMQKGSFEDVGAILLTTHRILINQGVLRP